MYVMHLRGIEIRADAIRHICMQTGSAQITNSRPQEPASSSMPGEPGWVFAETGFGWVSLFVD
jgi:hypothetical protein